MTNPVFNYPVLRQTGVMDSVLKPKEAWRTEHRQCVYPCIHVRTSGWVVVVPGVMVVRTLVVHRGTAPGTTPPPTTLPQVLVFDHPVPNFIRFSCFL